MPKYELLENTPTHKHPAKYSKFNMAKSKSTCTKGVPANLPSRLRQQMLPHTCVVQVIPHDSGFPGLTLDESRLTKKAQSQTPAFVILMCPAFPAPRVPANFCLIWVGGQPSWSRSGQGVGDPSLSQGGSRKQESQKVGWTIDICV